ncbi:MAG: glycosyltransferase [Beduini sp.]|uniref:glycosyltransferase n=1 Tax=Beduini sp. TaxID=1922300 RepID=UPI00399F0385
MKKIAIIDVAAENSGAKSLFDDFITFISSDNCNIDYQWDVYTSLLDFKETENIKLYKDPNIKKSWIHRIIWENVTFPIMNKRKKYDLIISLQNKGVPVKNVKQIVYFHNILLTQNRIKFSPFKKNERLLYIYSKLIGPLSIRTLKKVSAIFVQNETTLNILKDKIDNTPIFIAKPNINIQNINNQKRAKKIKGFIYPATAHSYKCHDLIIKAVQEENWDQNFNIIFTISGNENSYANEILKNCINNSKFKFVGQLDRSKLLNMYKDYGLINCSKLESFGFPLYEAQIYKTPIVSVDEEYAKEALENYTYAYICQRKSEELAHFMRMALNSEYPNQIIFRNELTSQWDNMMKWIKINI